MTSVLSRYPVRYARLIKPALLGVLLLLNCFAVRNFLILSANMIYGNVTSAQTIPRPVYSLSRLPETPNTVEYLGVGRIGSDFAQVYFPAQQTSSLQSAYDHKATLDPWGRPSRYSPSTILLCAVTLCRLSYGYAAFADMLVQLLLFYALMYHAFGVLDLGRFRLAFMLFANLCLFLTPVGLSWFERGQFSLYIASSYILLLLSLLKRRPMLILAAAFIASIKWTSFPVIAVILLAFLCGSQSWREFRSRALYVTLFSAVVGALVVLPALFAHGTGSFLIGLVNQEMRDNPSGLSLLKFAPRSLVKLIPLALIALGYLNSRSSRDDFFQMVPYALGVAAILIVYPTRANDYSVPTLLAFLPFMLVWSAHSPSNGSLPRSLLLYLFLAFLIIASFSTQVTGSTLVMVIIYLVWSSIYLLTPWLFSRLAMKSSPVPGFVD